MAEEENTKKARRLRQAAPTVRQQIEKQQAKDAASANGSRAQKAGRSAARSFKATGRGVAKVFRPLRFLRKPLRFLAKILGLRYVANSWRELRQVTWPDRRKTRQLTTAVLVFAIIFGVVVAAVDYGLDKLFKLVFVN